MKKIVSLFLVLAVFSSAIFAAPVPSLVPVSDSQLLAWFYIFDLGVLL